MKTFAIKKIYLLFLFFAISQSFGSSLITSSDSQSKKGGICFRTDDNTDIAHFNALASIFDNYNLNYGQNFHLSLALNLGASEFNSQDYINSIKAIQQNGHEIMDHTPNHRTNFFFTKFNTQDYFDNLSSQPIPGVDHIIGNKICIEYQQADTTKATRKGYCDIKGDTIKGDFSNFNDTYWNYSEDLYIYFRDLDKLVFIENNINNSTQQKFILDIWEDQIDLGTHSNIRYYAFTKSDIGLTIDGIKVLANESQKLANLYGLDSIKTWIQPGGRHPYLHADDIKLVCGDSLGYVAGAIYPNESIKAFNEYNPDSSKAFGMQWGTFFEDYTSWSLDRCKNAIADGIARHKMLIGHNHFYTLTGNHGYENLAGYFEKVDSLLSWCRTNDIPVKTYSEWANILYNQPTNPYENVFPPLNVSLNNETNLDNPDGRPDGYYPRYWSGPGVWETDPEAPSIGNYCYSVTDTERLFRIDDLAGLEKGDNDFEIWTKGGSGDAITVKFTYKEGNVTHNKTFKFPAASSTWTKYNLSQSINGNTNLYFPETTSLVTVEAKCSNYNGVGKVKVSGMYLAKMKPTITANLKLFIEGAYVGSDLMEVNTPFKNSIPLNQPFNNNPWYYEGSELVGSIPTDVIDWVLVELRSSTNSSSLVIRQAGFLKTDGTIINADGSNNNIQFKIAEGNYYVVVYQRNHLPVMSATQIEFR